MSVAPSSDGAGGIRREKPIYRYRQKSPGGRDAVPVSGSGVFGSFIQSPGPPTAYFSSVKSVLPSGQNQVARFPGLGARRSLVSGFSSGRVGLPLGSPFLLPAFPFCPCPGSGRSGPLPFLLCLRFLSGRRDSNPRPQPWQGGDSGPRGSLQSPGLRSCPPSFQPVHRICPCCRAVYYRGHRMPIVRDHFNGRRLASALSAAIRQRAVSAPKEESDGEPHFNPGAVQDAPDQFASLQGGIALIDLTERVPTGDQIHRA